MYKEEKLFRFPYNRWTLAVKTRFIIPNDLILKDDFFKYFRDDKTREEIIELCHNHFFRTFYDFRDSDGTCYSSYKDDLWNIMDEDCRKFLRECDYKDRWLEKLKAENENLLDE